MIKKILISLIVATGFLLAQPMPVKQAATAKRYTMEVESIRYSDGSMVLRGRGDKRMRVHADKKAHNLRKIRPGDWLEVTEREEIRVVGQKGGRPFRQVDNTRVTGPKSKVPTLKEETLTTIVAKVVKIDHARRTMVLEGPKGSRYEARVKPDVAHFENLSPGDTVKVTIHHVVQMRIRPMP